MQDEQRGTRDQCACCPTQRASIRPVATRPSAAEAAEQLRSSLADLGIPADVHEGPGLALVSVWVELVVQCDSEWFWWRSGWDERRNRAIYARHPATEPSRAARRIVFRYDGLRRTRPLSAVSDDVGTASKAPR